MSTIVLYKKLIEYLANARRYHKYDVIFSGLQYKTLVCHITYKNLINAWCCNGNDRCEAKHV